jgi:hypothetical protein
MDDTLQQVLRQQAAKQDLTVSQLVRRAVRRAVTPQSK